MCFNYKSFHFTAMEIPVKIWFKQEISEPLLLNLLSIVTSLIFFLYSFSVDKKIFICEIYLEYNTRVKIKNTVFLGSKDNK